MDAEIARMVDAARHGGGEGPSREMWRQIAKRARKIGDRDGLAFALRHVAGLELREGQAAAALGSAREAAEIYRSATPPPALDLANAMRLGALAQEAMGDDAAETWREARELYLQGDVAAGVAECDAHLSG